MEIYILLVLAIALAGGTYVATLQLKKTPAEGMVPYIHAILGAGAAIALAVDRFQRPMTSVADWLPVVLLAMVFVGGLYLHSFRKKNAAPPASAILIHAIFAVAAVGLLGFSLL